jgi:hypothetical protein
VDFEDVRPAYVDHTLAAYRRRDELLEQASVLFGRRGFPLGADVLAHEPFD